MPGIIHLIAVFLLLVQGGESCTPALCEAHCEFGFYKIDVMTSWGQPCNCTCCPPPVCRQCAMRRKIIARDENGCLTCRCGWMLK